MYIYTVVYCASSTVHSYSACSGCNSSDFICFVIAEGDMNLVAEYPWSKQVYDVIEKQGPVGVSINVS